MGNGEPAYLFEIDDAAQGTLKITGLGDEPEHMTAFVRASGEDLFLSVVQESQTLDAPPVYTWALVESEHHRLILWNPNYAKFVRLVGLGLLPGELDDDGLTLGELSPEHMELLTSEDHGVLFEWRDPIVLWRRDPPEASP